MDGFARWILRHKLLIVIFWIVVAVVAGVFEQRAINALTFQITVPGREGFETNQTITRLYRAGGNVPPLVPVITLPAGVSATEPHIRAALAVPFREVQTAVPGAHVASYASTGNRAFLPRDGRTTFGLVYPPGPPAFSTPGFSAIQRIFAHASVAGAHFELTGTGPLSTGANGGGVGVLGEVLLGGVGALLVLLFVFRSALAIAPLLMALVAIPTTFLLIWGLTALTTVSMFVEYLVGILGLGLGIDYSLLLVTPWREEWTSHSPRPMPTRSPGPGRRAMGWLRCSGRASARAASHPWKFWTGTAIRWLWRNSWGVSRACRALSLQPPGGVQVRPLSRSFPHLTGTRAPD